MMEYEYELKGVITNDTPELPIIHPRLVQACRTDDGRIFVYASPTVSDTDPEYREVREAVAGRPMLSRETVVDPEWIGGEAVAMMYGPTQ